MEKELNVIIVKYNKMYTNEFNKWAVYNSVKDTIVIKRLSTYKSIIDIIKSDIKTFIYNDHDHYLRINNKYIFFSPMLINFLVNTDIDKKIDNFTGSNVIDFVVTITNTAIANLNNMSTLCQPFVATLLRNSQYILEEAC